MLIRADITSFVAAKVTGGVVDVTLQRVGIRVVGKQNVAGVESMVAFVDL